MNDLYEYRYIIACDASCFHTRIDAWRCSRRSRCVRSQLTTVFGTRRQEWRIVEIPGGAFPILGTYRRTRLLWRFCIDLRGLAHPRNPLFSTYVRYDGRLSFTICMEHVDLVSQTPAHDPDLQLGTDRLQHVSTGPVSAEGHDPYSRPVSRKWHGMNWCDPLTTAANSTYEMDRSAAGVVLRGCLRNYRLNPQSCALQNAHW